MGAIITTIVFRARNLAGRSQLRDRLEEGSSVSRLRVPALRRVVVLPIDRADFLQSGPRQALASCARCDAQRLPLFRSRQIANERVQEAVW
jgi:hypothetical protein